MTGFASRSSYSPAAVAVMDQWRQIAGNTGDVKMHEECVARGLIQTGFLAERIMMLEVAPGEDDSPVSRLSDAAVEALDRLKESQPALWQATVALQTELTDIAIMEHMASLQGINLAESVGQDAIDAKGLQKARLMTRVFRSMEPLEVGVALELCQPPQG